MFTQHPLYHQFQHKLVGQSFHFEFTTMRAHFRDSQGNQKRVQVGTDHSQAHNNQDYDNPTDLLTKALEISVVPKAQCCAL